MNLKNQKTEIGLLGTGDKKTKIRIIITCYAGQNSRKAKCEKMKNILAEELEKVVRMQQRRAMIVFNLQ